MSAEDTTRSQTPEELLNIAVQELEHGDRDRGLQVAQQAGQEAYAAGQLEFAAEGQAQAARILRRKARFSPTQERGALIHQAETVVSQGLHYARELQTEGIDYALAHVLLVRAELYEDKGDLPRALALYEEALTYPLNPDRHTEVYKHVFRIKALGVQAKMGDTDALGQAELEIEQLDGYTPGEGEAQKLSAFQQAVWVSGGYLSLAEAILETKNTDQLAAVQRYLDEAQRITDTNLNMTNRVDDINQLRAIAEHREGIQANFESAQRMRVGHQEEEAIKLYQMVREEAERASDRWYASEALHMIGVTQSQQKEFDRASTSLQTAREEVAFLDQVLLGAIIRDLAGVRRGQDNLDGAEELLTQSVEILHSSHNRYQEGMSEVGLGRVQGLKGKAQEAEDHLTRGIELIEGADSGESYFRAKAYEYRAKARRQEKRLAEALEDLGTARTIYESIEEGRFLRDIELNLQEKTAIESEIEELA